ncbi:hypothetical protein OG21DRAFT_627226 [Imleria badia]|nr:hypothetical protein OG21DRAFT_627226 [Imleria badia]
MHFISTQCIASPVISSHFSLPHLMATSWLPHGCLMAYTVTPLDSLQLMDASWQSKAVPYQPIPWTSLIY